MTLIDIIILLASGVAIGLCAALAYLFHAGYWRGIAALHKLTDNCPTEPCVRIEEIDGTLYVIEQGTGIPHKLTREPDVTFTQDEAATQDLSDGVGDWEVIANPFPHHAADDHYFVAMVPVYEKDGDPKAYQRYENAAFTDDALIEARQRMKRISQRLREQAQTN